MKDLPLIKEILTPTQFCNDKDDTYYDEDFVFHQLDSDDFWVD